MFKIESYVTPILLSYVDKYVRDFKPADAQVSLWGGGVVLHNLVLKADVLQQELALPFTLISGRIHELHIQVPWTKIMSEPIVVTIDTIECVLSLNPPPASLEETPQPESPSRRAHMVETPPGYMQALVRRIVSNISLRVHHLIVKYAQDDIVMSLNVKHLAIDSSGSDWLPAFADIEQHLPVVRRLVRLDDLTLCLDKSDADGKIRFYQEPLLYRCQLELRVLTKLVSANTRRASSLSIQLRSSKLAWSVTSEQLVLLLRLIEELGTQKAKIPTPCPNPSTVNQVPPHGSSSNIAESARSGSWSEWAWSWMPTWVDKEGETEESVSFTGSTPISFSAYFDEVSLIFKVMEADGNNRKRSRSVLEMIALYAAVKSYFSYPTTVRVKFGVRTFTIRSNGKCICGHRDFNAIQDEPTIYLRKINSNKTEQQWDWPEEDVVEEVVTTCETAQDDNLEQDMDAPESPEADQLDSDQPVQPQLESKNSHEYSEFWRSMAPVMSFDYIHERSPPMHSDDPLDNPPFDFQHSDWVENCSCKIKIESMELNICMGLVHRLAALLSIIKELPHRPVQDLPMRVLTVEECEALYDNLPQRRLIAVTKNFHVRIIPWDHSLTEKPVPPPLILDIYVPKTVVLINMPLYPHRVCSAACQLPDDAGPVWQGARFHLTVLVLDAQAGLCSLSESQPRLCARADLRFVMHRLLNDYLFVKRESVIYNYYFKIREINLFGSAARLRATWEIMTSLIKNRESLPLRHTLLVHEAINDEDAVAIDLSFEEIMFQSFLTKNVNTYSFSMHSARGTMHHEPKGGDMKQAWIFSAPDISSTSPYIRVSVQWCWVPMPNAPDYIGAWVQATAFSVDPLFVAWLAYAPKIKPVVDSQNQPGTSRRVSSTQIFTRLHGTQSSTLRGMVWTGSGSGTELIHGRTRSAGSSSEPSEKKEKTILQPAASQTNAQTTWQEWWDGEKLKELYERLRNTLITIDLGIVLVYFTMSTVSAIESGSLRDAMERHATSLQQVLAISLGRLVLESSPIMKQVWMDIPDDGPTFTSPRPEQHPEEPDAFPWKMRISDISCYTLEVRAGSIRRDKPATDFYRQLKVPCVVSPRTVVELVITTVTIALITKSLNIRPAPRVEIKTPDETKEQTRLRYFAGRIDFKPNTMKDFLRGPARGKNSPNEEHTEPADPIQTPFYMNTSVMSIGINIYVDTSPIIVRLDHDQVRLVAAAIHCFKHITSLLQQPQLTLNKPKPSTGSPNKSLTRSLSEMEEIHDISDNTSTSDIHSELISIYEAHTAQEALLKVKTFFWFQWVVGRVSLIVSTHKARITFDLDDIITTVDLHRHYSQVKSKVASAFIKHFEKRGSEDWIASVLDGRVLEVREPANAQEENNFLTVTITQAQLSKLPTSWREELHPKLFEKNADVDKMWEIFVTLAPLEMVLRPTVVEHFLSFVREMSPRSFCPIQETKVQIRPKMLHWPFMFLEAGGLRLLLTCQKEDRNRDDTIIFEIAQISGNPYPENPICRTPVLSPLHPHWTGNIKDQEGRQYELNVRHLAVRTAQFRQIVFQETSEAEIRKGTAGENPALKWSLPDISPVITPVLHPLDIISVFAPTVYVSGTVLCGPAVELNFSSDCLIELSLDQLILVRRFTSDMTNTFNASGSDTFLDEEEQVVCPYASLLMDYDSNSQIININDNQLNTETSKPHLDITTTTEDTTTDSSVFSGFKSNKTHEDFPFPPTNNSTKKSVSPAVADQTADPVDYLEVFVTLGVLDVSLYTVDDNSIQVIALRPPKNQSTPSTDPVVQITVEEEKESRLADDMVTHASNRSISESTRKADIGKAKLELSQIPQARQHETNLPLIHVTLNQPHFYYCRKKHERTIQVSIFNLLVGLGLRQVEGFWYSSLITTAKGAPDPETDIPPALFSMKVVLPPGSAQGGTMNINPKGNISFEVDRPVLLEVSADKLQRLRRIYELIEKRVIHRVSNYTKLQKVTNPWLYKIRKNLENYGFESMTLQTSQIGICGSEGTVGWDGVTLQVAIGSRPDRLVIFGSMVALVMSAGEPGDRRHVLLQPLMLGCSVDATWEAWRRVEGGLSTLEPSLLVGLEIDSVTIDPRPEDLAAVNRIQNTLIDIFGTEFPQCPANSVESLYRENITHTGQNPLNIGDQLMEMSNYTNTNDSSDHYYKDDLRSGAFKIIGGVQLPVAYQVTLYDNCVTWKYPHPRTITRIVLSPVPGQNEETECVLEFYDPILCKWEPHTYFNLPVGESREAQLFIAPPEAVFALMWRFRACYEAELAEPPFEFDIAKFLPRNEPLMIYPAPGSPDGPKSNYYVTAEQLVGVLRVDSYFAPKLLPRIRFNMRLAVFEVNIHNSLPNLSSQSTSLEGYYVSRPLMRSHRVVCIYARDNTVRAQMGSPAGALVLLDSRISSDILDCSTGAMELFVDKVRTHVALSIPDYTLNKARSRVCMRKMRVAIHVPRLRTLHSLATDWITSIDQYLHETPSRDNDEIVPKKNMSKCESAAVAAADLDGRISLWIHNSTESALRIGQDATDEVVPLASGARVAYRWQNPAANRRLRFAVSGPITDWQWSRSIPFVMGTARVRLEDAENQNSDRPVPGSGVFLHTKVTDTGAQRTLNLSGRLILSNMLHLDLLYKVRARCTDSDVWQTITTGQLSSETVGRSILCGADSHLILKLKFIVCDTGWSGDIPLRECPKENVPWLVKVPLSGEIPYSSMWCRVTRAHADGRLLATMWPMYIIQSHLPLDINVLIHTEAGLSYLDLTDPIVMAEPKPQFTRGRGATTHIKVPGTTSARHSMTFKYKNANTLVTCQPVPLHYSATETTVFERQRPVEDVDELLNEILEWLRKYGRSAKTTWPYSIVTQHYYGTWLSSSHQPKADIVVRYQPVRGGGGCCLDVQVAPILLLCNATPISLTLRAHDAAPLCKLEPGVVMSPPSSVIKKPFYISVDLGRDIFVSGPLELLDQEPTPYFKPPPGQIIVDRPTEFAIQCNQKVALLNLYYEIKEEINVLGLSVTYVLMNRLNVNILICPIAVPVVKEDNYILRPTSYKVAEPTKEGSFDGTPLSRFWMRDRWNSTNPSELRTYLCLSLPASNYSAWTPVPIRLGTGPVRRSVALIDGNKRSVPVVVTQFKHEGRWLVSVGKDPCPQYIVHNRTRAPFAIAEPLHLPDEPSTSCVMAKQECDGTRWWCSVHPDMAVHYSSPSYCALYPAAKNASKKNYVPYLVIAKDKEEGELDWCQPVSVSDGEQLVQLRGGVTIKMRIRMHPHSTHIELQDVDHDDISASDIRRRLNGAFSSFTSKSSREDLEENATACSLECIIADSQNVDQSKFNIHSRKIRCPKASEITLIPSFPPIIPPSQVPFPPPPEVPGPSHYFPYASASKDSCADDSYSSNIRESPSTILLNEGHSSKLVNTEDKEVDLNKNNENLEATGPDQPFIFSSEFINQDWDKDSTVPVQNDRLRVLLVGASIEMSSAIDIVPLVAVHVDRMAVVVISDSKKTKATVSVGHVQVDNRQHNTGLYDFAVLASTGGPPTPRDRWLPIWTMFQDGKVYAIRQSQAKLLLSVQYDKWTVLNHKYRELTEVSLHVGPISLYIEDAYVKALTELYKMAFPQSVASNDELALAEEWSLMNPLRLRSLHIDPLNLTLTLHTAVRMYIALDQSPLRLSAFKVQDMITTPDNLTHMLTVHYLSAAILGAGWVVGGLELLGAPGALAARVSNATGGIRGIASATAAALVRSVSCWAGSLARNLDLLAGDEEHARRAAAARRRPPESFGAGLMTGITNFAINILGAVGGLAHHPFVGVAVGESGSSATALRRGLIGALTKPLSATADLVAFAGHGLLKQTGWDNNLECRLIRWSRESCMSGGWRRDCVRWSFRLAELTPIVGFEVLLDNTPLHLLITHKYLIIADTDTERIVETIDLRHCKLAPYQGPIIQLIVMQKRASKVYDTIIIDEDEEYQVSASAMARVAHYTGSTKSATIGPEYRLLSLLPPPGRSFTLQAALAAALHHNADSHFPLL